MSSDGADLGVPIDKALTAVLGGDQPSEDEMMSVQEMREKLLAAPRCTDPEALADYSTCAESCAGEILRWALANPERYASTPMETEISWPDKAHGSGKDYNNPVYGRRGLYEVMKEDGIPLDKLGLTGFMYGYAYNAAARCLELPPQPNPAILEI